MDLTTVDTVAAHEQSYAGLLPLLQRLDKRLAAAVEAAERVFAARAAGDLYRGLAISPADVVAAFGRVPGEPFLSLSIQAHELAEATNSLSLCRLLWLQGIYGLTDLDLDVVLIGLAPEIDLRYERLYAYLQDDVTRRRPSVDLALNLLCASAGEKLHQRERFAPDAPLIHHRLIEVFADSHHLNPPLLARFFRLDEQVVRFLLLDDSMDSRLAHFCCMVTPAAQESSAPLTDEMQQKLHAIALNRPKTGLRVYFEGPAHCGQSEAVAALASTLDIRVLQADIIQFSASTNAQDEILDTLVREAWFRGAVLHCHGLTISEEVPSTDRFSAFWQTLKEMPSDCVMQGEAVWVPAANKPQGVVTVHFSYPATEGRKQWWQRCLEQSNVTPDDALLTSLAHRYRLTYAQIQDAAKVSVSAASVTNVAAARSQTGHELARLTNRIVPRYHWKDLVLPDDVLTQLHEICDRVSNRERVMNEWGFGQKLSYGKGTTVLFSGSSGTGKTMAAEVIANELGLDLYRIDLSRVVDKYIGETEKNLNRIFTAAEHANAILFFDEADALFGKRTEVRDSHDRFANIEISYLLQKMEEYEGLAILATNLRQNLDDAFMRRLAFIVHFPFPDEQSRRRIWEGIWPATTPCSEEVDLDFLALQFKLSGGNIKNIGLAATYLAAADGGMVNMEHLFHATQREFQKMGKMLSEAELYGERQTGMNRK